MVACQVHTLEVVGSSPAPVPIAYFPGPEGANKVHWKTIGVFCVLLISWTLTVAQDQERIAKRMLAQAVNSKAPEDAVKEAGEIIRNNFNMAMIVFGAGLGSTVTLLYVIMRALTVHAKADDGSIVLDSHAKRGMYWVLSMLFSIMVTPWLARSALPKLGIDGQPEQYVAAAGGMAMLAWVLMRVMDFITGRFQRAARDKGLRGIQDEIRGTNDGK